MLRIQAHRLIIQQPSSQTSNGSSAARRFGYDRWGNRTGVWDATSGGNQIQNVALQQSGGAPTNRIQTVYPPKTNFARSSNGSVATASSTYSAAYAASATINGDRKGTGWGEVGGGWNDATANTYPDWLQVTFNGSKSIDEIDVFTLQDNFSNPSEPTESMTFSQYGIVDFQVQYWNGLGWQTVSGGNITGNNKVWKKINFSQITTSKIRVNVTNALSSYSRLTELEAWGPGPGISYTYDAVGNVTNDGSHTYTYDAGNRLVSVDGGATAQYSYDYQNQRVKTVSGGATTHYVWEGGYVIAEHDGAASGQWTRKVEYIYVRGSLIATQHYTVGQQQSTATRYYLRDKWSTRLVLDSSGNVIGRQGHLPFGEEFAESGTQEKHHFTSYEADSGSGTDYAVNRQYSQSVGRFGSADPYQASSYLVNPQSWNRYSYVENDPIHNVDPLGLMMRVPTPEDPDTCSDYVPPDLPPRCSAELPINIDELAIVDTILHEHTSTGNVGKGEYVPGHGLRRDGPTITWDTLSLEALAFASAIRNQADATHNSVIGALLDDNYIANPKQSLAAGAALAVIALASADDSPACHELKLAIGAAQITAGWRILSAEYRWWKAVIQYDARGNPFQRRNRRGQHSIRFGDTDFSDHF